MEKRGTTFFFLGGANSVARKRNQRSRDASRGRRKPPGGRRAAPRWRALPVSGVCQGATPARGCQGATPARRDPDDNSAFSRHKIMTKKKQRGTLWKDVGLFFAGDGGERRGGRGTGDVTYLRCRSRPLCACGGSYSAAAASRSCPAASSFPPPHNPHWKPSSTKESRLLSFFFFEEATKRCTLLPSLSRPKPPCIERAQSFNPWLRSLRVDPWPTERTRV